MNDEELNGLVDKARRRDADALAGVCELYYPRLVKYMCYRADAQSAEDLAGEVILKLMKGIDSQTGRFEPWLYRIARNVLIDQSRYQKVRPVVELDADTAQSLLAKPDLTLDSGARLDIYAGLRMLSDEYRELLTLRFIQGMSSAEVGEVMGKRAGAVRVMQIRALRALKKLLDVEVKVEF